MGIRHLKEDAESYNARAQQIIDHYSFDKQDFMILKEGRGDDEQSVVLVQNGKYMGFGYMDNNLDNTNLDLLLDCVKSYPDNREVQQIIRSYIRKNKVKLIQL